MQIANTLECETESETIDDFSENYSKPLKRSQLGQYGNIRTRNTIQNHASHCKCHRWIPVKSFRRALPEVVPQHFDLLSTLAEARTNRHSCPTLLDCKHMQVDRGVQSYLVWSTRDEIPSASTRQGILQTQGVQTEAIQGPCLLDSGTSFAIPQDNVTSPSQTEQRHSIDLFSMVFERALSIWNKINNNPLGRETGFATGSLLEEAIFKEYRETFGCLSPSIRQCRQEKPLEYLRAKSRTSASEIAKSKKDLFNTTLRQFRALLECKRLALFILGREDVSVDGIDGKPYKSKLLPKTGGKSSDKPGRLNVYGETGSAFNKQRPAGVDSWTRGSLSVTQSASKLGNHDTFVHERGSYRPGIEPAVISQTQHGSSSLRRRPDREGYANLLRGKEPIIRRSADFTSTEYNEIRPTRARIGEPMERIAQNRLKRLDSLEQERLQPRTCTCAQDQFDTRLRENQDTFETLSPVNETSQSRAHWQAKEDITHRSYDYVHDRNLRYPNTDPDRLTYVKNETKSTQQLLASLCKDYAELAQDVYKLDRKTREAAMSLGCGKTTSNFGVSSFPKTSASHLIDLELEDKLRQTQATLDMLKSESASVFRCDTHCKLYQPSSETYRTKSEYLMDRSRNYRC